MELIDRERLRATLINEQAKHIMSDHMTDKHVGAGFLLAIAELDSQLTIDAIPLKDLLRLWNDYIVSHGNAPEDIEVLINKWKKEG